MSDIIEFDYQGKKVWCNKKDWDCNQDFMKMKIGIMTLAEFNKKWPQKEEINREATKQEQEQWHDNQNRRAFFGNAPDLIKCQTCGLPLDALMPYYPYCSEPCRRNKDE